MKPAPSCSCPVERPTGQEREGILRSAASEKLTPANSRASELGSASIPSRPLRLRRHRDLGAEGRLGVQEKLQRSLTTRMPPSLDAFHKKNTEVADYYLPSNCLHPADVEISVPHGQSVDRGLTTVQASWGDGSDQSAVLSHGAGVNVVTKQHSWRREPTFSREPALPPAYTNGQADPAPQAVRKTLLSSVLPSLC